MAEWEVFYSLEPLGERRGDVQAALLATTMANIWRGKGSAAAKLSDYLMDFEPRREKQQTDDEMKAILIRLTGQMGGEFRKAGK